MDSNARLELIQCKASDVWPKPGVARAVTVKKTPHMGSGVFALAPIQKGTPFLREAGLRGDRDDIRLAAALVATGTTLSFLPGDPGEPDSWSPFPDVSLQQWNTARRMASSNQYTVDNHRILFRLLSRVNHSCNPNAVRRHDKDGVTTLFALRDIKAGQQILLQYSPKAGHEEDSHFKCGCSATTAERKATWESLPPMSTSTASPPPADDDQPL
jgi:hypothetical protein